MRFFIAVIDTQSRSGSSDEIAAIDIFNEKLQAGGHWVFACGIDSPSSAKVIDNRNNLGKITDGPLLQADEFVSGFWIIEVDNPSLALELATEGSRACNRRVELRPLLG
jgi:hypothetical protein